MDAFRNLLDFVVTSLKNMIKAEPARFIGYGGAIAIGVALWVSSRMGVEFSTEFLSAIGVFGTAIAGEIIRRLVFAPDTTQAIADRAAATGNTDIGQPPDGSVG